MDTYSWLFDLAKEAADDEWHQGLLRELDKLTGPFLRVCERLSPADREIITDYICAVEELEHSRMLLAYELGVKHGRRSP